MTSQSASEVREPKERAGVALSVLCVLA